MADEVAAPQICLVIELAQPRKEEDGSITPAEIETIRANLSARYFDIRTVTPEDQTDEDGVYTGSTTKYTETDDPHEFRAKYPFTVFAPHEYVQREPGRDSEWVVGFGEGDDYAECLVLGTRDIVEALARFREEHATVPIWSALRRSSIKVTITRWGTLTDTMRSLSSGARNCERAQDARDVWPNDVITRPRLRSRRKGHRTGDDAAAR